MGQHSHSWCNTF